MKHESVVRGRVKVWHSIATVSEIEDAFGLRSIRYHNIGDQHGFEDTRKYTDSYCQFEIFPTCVSDPTDALVSCIEFIESKKKRIGDLFYGRGTPYIVLAVANDTLQVDLDTKLINRINDLSFNLLIEVHSRDHLYS